MSRHTRLRRRSTPNFLESELLSCSWRRLLASVESLHLCIQLCRYKSQISSNNKNGQNHEGIERKPSDNIVVFLIKTSCYINRISFIYRIYCHNINTELIKLMNKSLLQHPSFLHSSINKLTRSKG